jgi:hypothetical protein
MSDEHVRRKTDLHVLASRLRLSAAWKKLLAAVSVILYSVRLPNLRKSIFFAWRPITNDVTMVGATPYKLFLKVPWVNKQLASSDFTFRRRQTTDGVKYAKNGAGKTTWRLFPQPVIEKRGCDGFLGAGLAKNKFCTDMLGLLAQKPL